MCAQIAIVALVKLERDKLLFYNPQSVGLAKALAAHGHDVDVYSFEDLAGSSRKVTNVAPRVKLIQQDSPGLGGNAIRVSKHIESHYDAIICFSDIQLAYGSLDAWCRRHRIPLFPYVGVIHSSSENWLLNKLMGLVAARNVKQYQARLVFAKNQPVKSKLEKASVRTVLAPVGLDLSYMKKDFACVSQESCKREAGFRPEDRVLLFIGRLVEEKRPLALIDLFHRLSAHDDRYKLCIIGDGHLKSLILERISGLNLTEKIRHHPLVENAAMWKFYHMAEFSINLNVDEIFGMSLLEAMYYKTPVVARRAPGPEIIISHNEDGYLCDSDEAIFETIIQARQEVSVEQAHRKVVEDFDWIRTSRLMLDAIQSTHPALKLLCT